MRTSLILPLICHDTNGPDTLQRRTPHQKQCNQRPKGELRTQPETVQPIPTSYRGTPHTTNTNILQENSAHNQKQYNQHLKGELRTGLHCSNYPVNTNTLVPGQHFPNMDLSPPSKPPVSGCWVTAQKGLLLYMSPSCPHYSANTLFYSSM